MNIERVDYTENPQDIVMEGFDCIWLALEDRETPTPPVSKAIQWLDWKLQGKVSRFLLDGVGKTATFLPTMDRIPSKMVALSGTQSWDWEAFRRNCEGMQLDRILVFCESPQALASHEQGLKSLKGAAFPRTVNLATEKATDFK